MTDNDSDQRADDVAGERTSAFRADFTNAQDAAATAGAEGQLFGAEAPPQGSGLLVVKRGPNAGSRFLLDRATTTAGRHRIAISSSMTSLSAAGMPSSGA